MPTPISSPTWPSHAAGSAAGTSSSNATTASSSNGRGASVPSHKRDDIDEGLVMKEKDRYDEAFGHAGGREMGVTRPKRRLSSPSPPHTIMQFDSSSTESSRAQSAASSPPASPSGFQNFTPPFEGRNAGGGPSSSFVRSPTTARIDEKEVSYPPPGSQGSSSSGPPMLCGVELKWISLLTLALQNAFLTIIMHYSRISTPPDRTYSAAAAVLLNELLKGTISVLVALWTIDGNLTKEQQPFIRRGVNNPKKFTMLDKSRLQALGKSVFSPDCYKLAIPAILYVIQNNLQYVAASNLDVATFQVTYQMKILTTAFFSVIMLRKRLSRAKWAALLMLAIGVGIVQLQSAKPPAHAAAPVEEAVAAAAAAITDKVGHHAQLRRDDERSIANPDRVMNPLKGFLAVTLACVTSGLAGVYFELILKTNNGGGTQPNLWVRNTQLSIFSLVPAIAPILFSGHSPDMSWLASVASKFSNFNGWAIGTILTQTFGGLITAIVIRYSDNIMKGFATSLSIIISFMASVVLFAHPITVSFVLGASIVLGATILYNTPSVADSPPTRTAVGVLPGSPIPTSAPILGEPQPPSRTSSALSLLGIGSSSRPGSRRTSASDLRAQFPITLGQGMTSGSPALSRSGSFQRSGAATPFLTSNHNSHTNIAEYARSSLGNNNSRLSPSPTKSKPNLTVDTRVE